MTGLSNGHDKYGQAALHRECSDVAATRQGRNDRLNRAGFALGQIVGAGALDRIEVEARLFEAATVNGHVQKHGPAVTRATISSGVGKGAAQPRVIPETSRTNGASRPKPTARSQEPARPAPTFDDGDIPLWTEPVDGRPVFFAIGLAEPRPMPGEIRRHLYRRGTEPVRIKIKREAGWIDLYKVRRTADGAIGWQAKRPVNYTPVPYIGPATAFDPFDPEHAGEVVAWVEGEKDVDTAQAAGLLAFSYGSASDKTDPGDLLRDRDVVIVADNDPPGEKCAAWKAEVALRSAARVRVARFADMAPGADLADFIEGGGTVEQLLARAEDVQAEAPARDALDPERFDDAGPNEPFINPRATPQKSEPPPVRVKASPFVWRDPRTIPRRAWLYGRHYIRQFITVTVAPGGVGKSSLVLVEAIVMATGRPLLGITPAQRLRVWYVNLEDPLEEIERRVAAILLHYRIDPDELAGQLFIDSGDECELMVMAETPEGAAVVEPVVAAVKSEITTNQIDVLMLDPFVSTHGVNENDNNKINAVKRTFAGIARALNIGLELVHHVRKGVAGQGDYTVDDGRGAKALVDGARVARVLNGMSKQQGEQAGVDNSKTYFNVTTGKANLAPASDKADWFHLASVSLGNGSSKHFDDSDHIGVVTTWQWPDALADVTVDHLRKVQAAVAEGRWRENHQAAAWVGVAVAQVLGLDLSTKAHKTKVLGLLKTWIGTGMLVKVEGHDERRKPATFVEVGNTASD